MRNTANAVCLSSIIQNHTIGRPPPCGIQCAAAAAGHHLPLGPGTFMHNAAAVHIVVSIKADLIDNNNDLVGAGVSGICGMVKGREANGRAHRRDHGDIAHGLSQVYVS